MLLALAAGPEADSTEFAMCSLRCGLRYYVSSWICGSSLKAEKDP